MIGTEYTKDKCSFCGKEVSVFLWGTTDEYGNKMTTTSFNKGKHFCNIECLKKYNKEIKQQKIDYLKRNKFTRFEIMDI